jgi:hypothetical protein
MHRQQRITVDIAVRILRTALQEAGTGRVDTLPVRLALRCLWHHCPERYPLITFWDGAQQDYPLGRSERLTTSFHGIVRQLRQAGAYTDETV